MAQVFVIARIEQPVVSQEKTLGIADELSKILGSVPGFLSATMWASQSKSGSYMLLTHYESEEASLEGLNKALKSQFFVKVANSFSTPIDLKRVKTLSQIGVVPAELELDDFMSISERTSDPGFGEELATELTRICAEMTAIPGCKGSMVGHLESLSEEIISIVFWESVESFMASLPTKLIYDVRLFHRVK